MTPRSFVSLVGEYECASEVNAYFKIDDLFGRQNFVLSWTES